MQHSETHRACVGFYYTSPTLRLYDQPLEDAWNAATADFQSGQHPGDLPPGEDLAPLAADTVVGSVDADGNGTPDELEAFQDRIINPAVRDREPVQLVAANQEKQSWWDSPILPWNWFGKDAEANADEWEDLLNQETEILKSINKLFGTHYTKLSQITPAHRKIIEELARRNGAEINWEDIPSEQIEVNAGEIWMLDLAIGAARVVEGIDVAIGLADGAVLIKQGGKWFLKRAGTETLEQLSKRQADDLIRKTAKAVDGQVHHIFSNKGAWRKTFQQKLKDHGLNPNLLDDGINQLPLPGHNGRHVDDYHKLVQKRLDDALDGKYGAEAEKAFIELANELREELLKNPRLPYRNGGLGSP